MAEHQIGSIAADGFNSKERAVSKSAGSSAGLLNTPANYTSIGAMRTRLAAINATYYTASKLNTMTVNDMVYAIRLNDDPETL